MPSPLHTRVHVLLLYESENNCLSLTLFYKGWRVAALVEAIKKKVCHCKTRQNKGRKETKMCWLERLAMRDSLHSVTIKQKELCGEFRIRDNFSFSIVTA